MVCTGTKPKYPKELWIEACNDIKVKVGNDSPFGLEVSCESLNETVIIPSKRMLKSKNFTEIERQGANKMLKELTKQ